jgi:hypothetical protein
MNKSDYLWDKALGLNPDEPFPEKPKVHHLEGWDSVLAPIARSNNSAITNYGTLVNNGTIIINYGDHSDSRIDNSIHNHEQKEAKKTIRL